MQLDQRKRRTYRGEEKWFPLLEELRHTRLRLALIDAGVSPQVAGGIVWFIEAQQTLPRHQTGPSRTRYRQTLAELDPEQVLDIGRAIPGQFNSGTRRVA